MQLLIILVLVLLNGVLAMSEIAVLNAREPRLKDRAEAGSRGAQVALNLRDNPTRFMSTVQVGITLVGILAGAFGGATVGRQFGDWLAATFPPVAPYSDPVGIGAIVVLTTYLSLVLGELVPKRVAYEYPEAIAIAVAGPMHRFSQVIAPVRVLLTFSTNLMLRLLGINPNDDPSVTESEVLHMLETGTTEGVFDPNEVDMVEGVFQLDDTRIGNIMTPRINIRALYLSETVDEIKEKLLNSPHSMYPVFDGKMDNVVGVLKVKDLIEPLLHGDTIDLKKVMRKPLLLPEVMFASRALETFKISGMHMALVIGEHGGVEGLLTINDVLEEIVGDIDADEPQFVQRDDGSWLIDGTVSMGELDDLLESFTLPEDEVGSYQTLAGFIMARLERLPRIADHFEYAELRFEVVDMDGARVDRILVTVLESDESPDEDEA